MGNWAKFVCRVKVVIKVCHQFDLSISTKAGESNYETCNSFINILSEISYPKGVSVWITLAPIYTIIDNSKHQFTMVIVNLY